jgi:hypothetical protein
MIHHAFPASALSVALASGMAASLVASAALAGPTWDLDNTSDAKQSAQDAQAVTTAGSVLNISGSLSGIPLLGEVDLVDMYLVYINAPMTFYMSTAGGQFGGSANFDSQLFIFSAQDNPTAMSAGALLANHLAAAGSSGSFVGSASSDGSYRLESAGFYYLAISAFGTNPYASNNELLWGALTDPGVVAYGQGTELAYWQNVGDVQGGAYTIHLNGVTGVPAPGACGLLGLCGLLRSRRRN